MKKYYPEGARPDIEAVEKRLSSPAELKNAFLSGESLEARAVLCDRGHNLDVDLRCMKGFMPRKECAMGIEDNTVRDIAIISRVNKPVDFVITGFSENERGETFALLSRRKLQEECAVNYTSRLIPGDIIDARVTHLEPFGAFCDIGAGISALMPIDGISVSRIPHPCVRFSVNQDIKAVVKSIDENGRITLSQKELLGTWEENASKFAPGETVPGVIRSVEDYGIFVELAPNLAGLAECRIAVELAVRFPIHRHDITFGEIFGDEPGYHFPVFVGDEKVFIHTVFQRVERPFGNVVPYDCFSAVLTHGICFYIIEPSVHG